MLISVATSLAVIVLAFGDRIQFATTDAARSGLLPMSYLALSAVVLSSVVQVGQRESLVRKVVADPTDFRLAMALTPYLAIALLIGCASAAMAREARAARMPQSWRGISKLAPLGFRELTLKVDHDPDRLLPSATRYWLPNRRIHVVEPEVRLRDLPFESVSRQNPMLIQNFGCQGVGHADAIAIEGLGCAIYAPPGLEIDSRYPFNRTFLPISFAGMTDREAGGRWNVGRNMALRILSDPERAGLADQRYLNVFVHAFLTPDAPSVRLAVEWGTTHRTGETAVSGQDSFSVPVVSGDWTGNRVWALPVTILFPGGGNVLFHELSITAQPLGRPVQ
jgi:hypothetical protein